jgi:hypothetical protein
MCAVIRLSAFIMQSTVTRPERKQKKKRVLLLERLFIIYMTTYYYIYIGTGGDPLQLLVLVSLIINIPPGMNHLWENSENWDNIVKVALCEVLHFLKSPAMSVSSEKWKNSFKIAF